MPYGIEAVRRVRLLQVASVAEAFYQGLQELLYILGVLRYVHLSSPSVALHYQRRTGHHTEAPSLTSGSRLHHWLPTSHRCPNWRDGVLSPYPSGSLVLLFGQPSRVATVGASPKLHIFVLA